MTKIKYPVIKTKDGKSQHVPVVCKNKDVLIGHINCLNTILYSLVYYTDLNDEILDFIDPGLDSIRFNNWIDDGVSCLGWSKEKIIEFWNQRKAELLNDGDNHPDNKKGTLDPGYFSVDCTGCGNFVRWNNAKELPNENYKCDICDRILIHYTYLDDEDIEFDEGKD